MLTFFNWDCVNAFMRSLNSCAASIRYSDDRTSRSSTGLVSGHLAFTMQSVYKWFSNFYFVADLIQYEECSVYHAFLNWNISVKYEFIICRKPCRWVARCVHTDEGRSGRVSMFAFLWIGKQGPGAFLSIQFHDICHEMPENKFKSIVTSSRLITSGCKERIIIQYELTYVNITFLFKEFLLNY